MTPQERSPIRGECNERHSVPILANISFYLRFSILHRTGSAQAALDLSVLHPLSQTAPTNRHSPPQNLSGSQHLICFFGSASLLSRQHFGRCNIEFSCRPESTRHYNGLPGCICRSSQHLRGQLQRHVIWQSEQAGTPRERVLLPTTAWIFMLLPGLSECYVSPALRFLLMDTGPDQARTSKTRLGYEGRS
jgi:hypothetical protein